MPYTKETANHKLPQWEADNKPILKDFNDAFATIDAAFGNKANLSNPAFTGIPTAPTAAQTVNNTQIATTAYIRTGLRGDTGLWTPAITGVQDTSNNTYGIQVGRYHKIGRLMLLTFNVQLSVKDPAMTGVIRIRGLPEVSLAVSGNRTYAALSLTALNTNSFATFFGSMWDNTTYITIQGKVAGSDHQEVDVTLLSNSSRITGTLIYQTAS